MLCLLLGRGLVLRVLDRVVVLGWVSQVKKFKQSHKIGNLADGFPCG